MESDAQTEPTATPRPKRRWLQFSTRALLVVVTLFGVTLGVVVWRAERQREAVATLRAIEVAVIYASDNTAPEAKSLAARWLPRDWVDPVVEVYFNRHELTNSEFENVKYLTGLQVLSLYHIQVTDSELMHLEGLSELKSLRLGNTLVTDAGLVHLRRFAQLKVLVLDDTQVSDAGLSQLEALTNLEQLYLEGTQVTTAGVTKLQETLPNCMILH